MELKIDMLTVSIGAAGRLRNILLMTLARHRCDDGYFPAHWILGSCTFKVRKERMLA